MPRHRIEHQPRHRAQRSVRKADRRVEFPAGPARSPSHAKPPGGPVTIDWEAIGAGASDRLVAFGAHLRPPRRVVTGAVRGLVVSPWFAAGAGFVVATGAFIYAPHASLQFETPCKLVVVCNQLVPEGGAQPPAIAGKGEGQVSSPAPSASATATLAGMTFRYAVKSHADGTFEMQLTVTSVHAISGWRLAFVIPGATNVRVSNANWQSSGTDGGEASGTAGYGGTSFSGAGSGFQSNWSGYGEFGPAPSEHHTYAHSLDLMVTGDGAPAAPANCFYNGLPCDFGRH